MHRDIKNNNFVIFLEDERKIVKLIDFGLSSLLINRFDPTGGVGVSNYKAPELYLIEDPDQWHQSTIPWYNEKIDIWALGCLFYWLLYDRYLFISPEETLDYYDEKPDLALFQTKYLDDCPRLIGRVWLDEDEYNFIDEDPDLQSESEPAPCRYRQAETQLLHVMLQPNYHQRPSAAELLTYPYFADLAPISSCSVAPDECRISISICRHRFSLMAHMFYQLRSAYEDVTILTAGMIYDKAVKLKRHFSPKEPLDHAKKKDLMEICMSLSTKMTSSYREYQPKIQVPADLVEAELNVLILIDFELPIAYLHMFEPSRGKVIHQLTMKFLLAYYFNAHDLFDLRLSYQHIQSYIETHLDRLLPRPRNYLVLDRTQSVCEENYHRLLVLQYPIYRDDEIIQIDWNLLP